MAKKIVVTKKAEDASSEVKTNPTATKKVAKVTPPPAPKAEATPVAKSASIHRGLKSGLPVMQYQDNTIQVNNKKKLTDEQLLADWRAEFPNTKGAWATDDKAGMAVVAIVRRLFNEGRHGTQKVFSDTPILRYGADGKPMAESGRKAKAEKATTKAA